MTDRLRGREAHAEPSACANLRTWSPATPPHTPLAASRGVARTRGTAPPRDASQGRNGTGPAPPPPIGRRAVTTSREAGRVCVCVYVCGVCFVIRTPADAVGVAACWSALRRGRGAAPGTPSYIRTRLTEAHVSARSPHAAHHAVRFSHARREPAAPHHTVYSDVGLPTARLSPITAKRTFATRHNIGCYIYRAYL